MNAVIAASLITAIGAVVLVVPTYWFTKARERDAELRKEKLEHYKNFTAAISGIIDGEGTEDGQRAFSLACNNLNLVASQNVLIALQKFQNEIRVSNRQKSRETHDELLSNLFYQIRLDLNVKPKDTKTAFRVGIWAAGAHPERNSREADIL
ncbi:hypothetical protein [Acidisoma sp. 7E03]